MLLALALALLAAEGRPLFYWGARPAVITAADAPASPTEARVLEVHAVLHQGHLILRFAFDRTVRESMYLPGGRPVSGRLRAILYVDADGDPATGLDHGPRDRRTGADRRIELGVISVGEDPAEKRAAAAVLSASVASLRPDGGERLLWRGDDAAPDTFATRGDWLELRLPAEPVGIAPGARLVLAAGNRTWEGVLAP